MTTQRVQIYALRDRLIDYFMTPFPAHRDREVLNSIAAMVNREGSDDPIHQAPHHFEVWKLCEIDENGQAHGKPELIADCSTLIRAGRPSARPRPQEVPGAVERLRAEVDEGLDRNTTTERPIASQVETTHRQRAPADRESQGTTRLSNN